MPEEEIIINERTGAGTRFQREDDLIPGEFVDVAQVARIKPDDTELEMVDVDELSPADGFKKRIPGLFVGDDLTLTLNCVPEEETHEYLRQDKDDKLPRKYRIQFPYDETLYSGGDYREIVGQVTKYALQELAADEVLQVEVTIAIVEKPTYEPLVEIVEVIEGFPEEEEEDY
jgi:hypothetical protein